MGRESLMETVGHELGHGIGIPHGSDMDALRTRLLQFEHQRPQTEADRKKRLQEYRQWEAMKAMHKE
jgi:predicted Zn-dependent protease